MTDSIVSTAWLRKSNFDEDPEVDEDGNYLGMDPVQAEVRASIAREHALLMMENEICEYSQWFKGIHNVVADALSRDDRTDDEL
jgi:thioredoxin-related protein